MICKYGMSEELGPVSYSDEGGDVFLGRDFAQRKDYSEETARQIDAAVSSLLTENYNLAKQDLENHREVLDKIVDSLLERETLEGKDLQILLEGRELAPLPPPPITEDSSESSDDILPDDSHDEVALSDPEPIVS